MKYRYEVLKGRHSEGQIDPNTGKEIVYYRGSPYGSKFESDSNLIERAGGREKFALLPVLDVQPVPLPSGPTDTPLVNSIHEELTSMNTTQLKTYAKDNAIDVPANASKADLIKAIETALAE